MHICTGCSYSDTSFYAADLHEYETGHVVLMAIDLDASVQEVAA